MRTPYALQVCIPAGGCSSRDISTEKHYIGSPPKRTRGTGVGRLSDRLDMQHAVGDIGVQVTCPQKSHTSISRIGVDLVGGFALIIRSGPRSGRRDQGRAERARRVALNCRAGAVMREG